MNKFGLTVRQPRGPRTRRRGPAGGRALAAAGAGVLAASGLALAPGATTVALAQDGAPVCSAPFCTVTLDTPGTGQSFALPYGVSTLEVTLYGAAGGTNYNGDVAGGDGAEVTASLALGRNAVVGIDVGGAGQGGNNSSGPDFAGGVNGGGAGDFSGGGGGATDITSGGTYLVVAGGGGGGGDDKLSFGSCFSGAGGSLPGGAGGNADTVGSPGQGITDGDFALNGGGGGQPGTTSAVGTGGAGGTVSGTVPCGNYSTSAGADGADGSGITGGSGTESTGGGGGGGYFGGGAGGEGASAIIPSQGNPVVASVGGGGGGASYGGGTGVTNYTVDDTGNAGQVNDGNGEAVLTYPDPVSIQSGPSYPTSAQQTLTVPAATGLLSPGGATYPPGDTVTASGPASGQSAQGGTVTVNTDGSFSYTPAAGFTGSDSFPYTVTDASGDYATGTVTVQVQPLAQAITFDSNAPSPGVVGSTYTPSATGGGSGNPVTFSIDSSSTAGACSVSSGVVSFTGTGLCVIDANQAAGGIYAQAQQVSQPVTVDATPAFVLDTPPATATAGQLYSYSFAASGTPAPFYSLAAGAPSWLSIDASTGTVSGTPPTGTGSFAYEVIAANAAGTSAAGPYEISVAPKAPKANLKASLSCPSEVLKGSTGVCALSVINLGPATADNVSIAALLRAKLSEVSCTGGCVKEGTGTFIWTLPSLASISSVYYTITVQGLQKGTGLLTVDAASGTTDPKPFNNVVSRQIAIKS